MATIQNQMFSTNDKAIRLALREVLEKKLKEYRKKEPKAEIFEELGVQHGIARIDYAIINGEMCGYEIKSDRDTLERLPEQVQEFNEVFDKLTLVVGKRYLYQAIHEIQEWWGIMLAKENGNGEIIFQTIRKAGQNQLQQDISIARLLWREEALKKLEQRNRADGIRSKPREFVYRRLVEILDRDTLKKYVSSTLISRVGWRSDPQPVTHGG
ncbi:MAG: hypothetical protein G01um101430_571 [Parcubacteria group bacterium Gr01-1014_30]|nr:MAG: hypothetical protein G01um101430_571 [Parcubacteria group bacterium Gr01-1014_30]